MRTTAIALERGRGEDHLETIHPGIRKQIADVGGPEGFEDAVASIAPIGDDESDARSHWGVTFAVDDADAMAERATALGGSVVVPPMDAPWQRMTVIADPQGATFTASKYVPREPRPGDPGRQSKRLITAPRGADLLEVATDR